MFNRVWNHDFHHPFWGTTIFGNTHLARLEYTEGDEDLDDDDDEKEKEDEAKKWWDVVVNILGVPRI